MKPLPSLLVGVLVGLLIGLLVGLLVGGPFKSDEPQTQQPTMFDSISCGQSLSC